MQNKLTFNFETEEWTDDLEVFIREFRRNGNPWTCSLKNRTYISFLESVRKNNYLEISTSEICFLQCYRNYLHQIPVAPRSISELKKISSASSDYLYLALCFSKLKKEDFLLKLNTLPFSLSYPILAQMYLFGIRAEENLRKAEYYAKLSPSTPDNRIILAQTYLEQNKISSCLDCLENDFTDSAEETKGEAYLRKGDRENAFLHFRKSRTEESTINLSLLLNDHNLSFALLYFLHGEKATQAKLSYLMKKKAVSHPQIIYDLLEVTYPKKKEDKFQFDREIIRWK